MVVWVRHHHAVDQDSGDSDLPRVQRTAVSDALHLGDHEPARVARRHGDREHFERECFPLHRDVAVGVGGGAADDADIDRERLVEEVLLAANLHELDEIFGRALVELPAAEARVGESAESHPTQMAGFARGDVTEEMRDHALRQVVGLDLVADGEGLQLWHEPPMPADHPLDEPRLRKMVEPPVLAVSLAGGIDEGEVLGLAEIREQLVLAGEGELFERDRDLLGEADADEAAGRDRVAAMDQPDRLARRYDLADLARLHNRYDFFGAHVIPPFSTTAPASNP